MTRARSEGIPPLNVLRRQLFAATNDGQLTPYTSWVDFGENLKHPESLVNFVAAYGQHPTIVTNAVPTVNSSTIQRRKPTKPRTTARRPWRPGGPPPATRRSRTR